jgi:exosortase/archaeosortase family protein
MLAGQPLLVTTACSAGDFFLMTAALVAAVPLTLFINALRLIVVAHAHDWVIPRMPEAYGAFLHMLTGAAVFLPALITLNLIFETYGRSRSASRA